MLRLIDRPGEGSDGLIDPVLIGIIKQSHRLTCAHDQIIDDPHFLLFGSRYSYSLL
jgi:hypothetical protein